MDMEIKGCREGGEMRSEHGFSQAMACMKGIIYTCRWIDECTITDENQLDRNTDTSRQIVKHSKNNQRHTPQLQKLHVSFMREGFIAGLLY